MLKIDALGDLFIWMSSGIADVAQWASAKGPATLVTSKEVAGFVRSLGLFEEVLPLDKAAFDRDLAYRWRFLSSIRRRGYDQVLQVRIARQFTVEDSLVRAAGAPAIGSTGDYSNLYRWEAAISDRYYESLITFTPPEHEMLRVRAFSQALTGKVPDRFEIDLSDATLPEHVAANYYLLAPGAGWSGRKWPIENFIAVARHISELQCIITGTQSEAEEGEKVARAVGGLNLCGRLGLADLVALAKNARFILANESGLSHIAGYCNTPSVSIVGGGHYNWFMPYPEESGLKFPPQSVSHIMPCYGCNWLCRLPHQVCGPVPCVEAVTVKSVCAAIAGLLQDPGVLVAGFNHSLNT